MESTNQADNKALPFKFLSFAKDDQGTEQTKKLKEAASKIEQAIARQKSVDELIDYQPPPESDTSQTDNSLLSLYERLEKNKKKKEKALEEAQKFSNYVSTLDEDDIGYLNDVEKAKKEEALRRKSELDHALADMKKRKIVQLENERSKEQMRPDLANSPQKSIREKLSHLLSKNTMKESRKKPNDAEVDTTKNSKKNSKLAASNADCCGSSAININGPADQKETQEVKKRKRGEEDSDDEANRTKHVTEMPGTRLANKPQIMQCIGILPCSPIITRLDTDSDSDDSESDFDAHLFLPALNAKPRVVKET